MPSDFPRLPNESQSLDNQRVFRSRMEACVSDSEVELLNTFWTNYNSCRSSRSSNEEVIKFLGKKLPIRNQRLCVYFSVHLVGIIPLSTPTMPTFEYY